MAKEFLADSFSVFRDPVSVTEALEVGLIEGQITGIQILLNQAFTGEEFSLLLKSAFYLEKPVRAETIPSDQSGIDQSDQHFAEEFRHKVVPLACARVTKAGFIEAWIGPTLVHAKHPLANAEKGQVNIEISKLASSLRNWRADVLLPENKIVTAHYLRFDIEDKPLALARSLDPIGKRGISICEIRQPIIEEGQRATVALLLNPCKAEDISCAVAEIRELPICFSIGPLYRVLGNPTRNLSS